MINHIAHNLKLLRNKHGLSVEKVANDIFVSRQTMTKWESGETTPDIDSAIALADYYTVPLEFLVGFPICEEDNFTTQMYNGRIVSVIDLDEGGNLSLPKKVLEYTGINGKRQLVLVADKRLGIALFPSQVLDDKGDSNEED